MAVVFGPYKLLRRIAAGGMGEVYLSVLERGGFRKPVAVKRILPGCCDRPDFAERFAAEAALSAMLNHANIVQIFDHGCIDGSSYLAMELVEGPDLAGLLAAGGPIEPPLAAEIALQLCRALGHAHERRDSGGRPCGIVHGDVSPSNILLTADGQVKLADFGIARLLGAAGAQGIYGKLAYLSPEQARGESPTPRSDIFALGLVLLEMLGGKKPRPESSAGEMLSAAVHAEHPPLEQVRADLSAAWRELLVRMLVPEPSGRMNSAAEVALFISEKLSPSGPERLGAFVSRHASAAVQNAVSTPEPTQAAGVPVDAPRRPGRRRLTAGLTLILVMAVLAGVLIFYGRPAAVLSTDRQPPVRPAGLSIKPVEKVNPPPAEVVPAVEHQPEVTTPQPKVAVLRPSPVHHRLSSPVEKKPLPPPTPPPAVEMVVEGPWLVSLDHSAVDSRNLRIEQRTPHLIELRNEEKNARVSLRLSPGTRSGWRMAVSADPWMNIQLDGRALGQTPRIKVALAAGEHHLLLSRQKHGLELPLRISLPH